MLTASQFYFVLIFGLKKSVCAAELHFTHRHAHTHAQKILASRRSGRDSKPNPGGIHILTAAKPHSGPDSFLPPPHGCLAPLGNPGLVLSKWHSTHPSMMSETTTRTTSHIKVCHPVPTLEPLDQNRPERQWNSTLRSP